MPRRSSRRTSATVRRTKTKSWKKKAAIAATAAATVTLALFLLSRGATPASVQRTSKKINNDIATTTKKEKVEINAKISEQTKSEAAVRRATATTTQKIRTSRISRKTFRFDTAPEYRHSSFTPRKTSVKQGRRASDFSSVDDKAVRDIIKARRQRATIVSIAKAGGSKMWRASAAVVGTIASAVNTVAENRSAEDKQQAKAEGVDAATAFARTSPIVATASASPKSQRATTKIGKSEYVKDLKDIPPGWKKDGNKKKQGETKGYYKIVPK